MLQQAEPGRLALRWHTAQAVQPGPSWQPSFEGSDASAALWWPICGPWVTSCSATWGGPCSAAWPGCWAWVSGWTAGAKWLACAGSMRSSWMLPMTTARSAGSGSESESGSGMGSGMSVPAHSRKGSSTSISQIQVLRIASSYPWRCKRWLEVRFSPNSNGAACWLSP